MGFCEGGVVMVGKLYILIARSRSHELSASIPRLLFTAGWSENRHLQHRRNKTSDFRLDVYTYTLSFPLRRPTPVVAELQPCSNWMYRGREQKRLRFRCVYSISYTRTSNNSYKMYNNTRIPNLYRLPTQISKRGLSVSRRHTVTICDTYTDVIRKTMISQTILFYVYNTSILLLYAYTSIYCVIRLVQCI